jgi:hypothetical protein
MKRIFTFVFPKIKNMNLESDSVKILAIISHVSELLALLWGVIFGLMNKTKSVIGFTVSQFFAGIFKVAIIMLFCLIISFIPGWMIFGLVFEAVELLFGRWGWSYIAQYVIAGFISGAICLVLIWCFASWVWTGTLNNAKIVINHFRAANKRLPLTHYQTLTIVKATYGANGHDLDVTDKLRKMVVRNTLTIKASNELAGDPVEGVPKKLIVNYKYDDKEKTIELNEFETKYIVPE